MQNYALFRFTFIFTYTLDIYLFHRVIFKTLQEHIAYILCNNLYTGLSLKGFVKV